MFRPGSTVTVDMRGTASASESPRPDDYLSCSYDERLTHHSWSFLKKLDIVLLAFWGIARPMGGCGVRPAHGTNMPNRRAIMAWFPADMSCHIGTQLPEHIPNPQCWPRFFCGMVHACWFGMWVGHMARTCCLTIRVGRARLLHS